jgi:hypothetical protein
VLNLQKITLVCADCKQPNAALEVFHVCLSLCAFGQALFFTHKSIRISGADLIKIPEIKSRAEYSRFCIKEMGNFNIECPFVLIVQHDSCIVNIKKWSDEFYKYDYIGPPWDHHGRRVTGGGGFSLRSRKLLKLMSFDPFIKGDDPEDMVICTRYRNYLESTYGMKFAPPELAADFATEQYVPHFPDKHPFGFHGKSLAYKSKWLKSFPMKHTLHLGNFN